jgi:microtubule-associated protein 1 light chain
LAFIENFAIKGFLPLLDHCKYLVPSHITIAEVMQIIRRRLQLHPDQAFYLYFFINNLIENKFIFSLVNEKSMTSMTQTIGHLYDYEKDEDGFLYIVYASQPAFG